MKRFLRDATELLLPTGCVVCRRWIPAGNGERARSIVCPGCRARLVQASWPRCPRCHAPRGTGRDEAAECSECREWPAALHRARYAHVLAPPASDLVHALKYEGWRELAGLMGRAMAREARRHLDVGAVDGPGSWLVVPVPTTVRRIRRRGYNQAALLAGAMAGALELPCREALRRSSAPRSQTALSPLERRENVRGTFSMVDPAAVAGRRVLLVDDVLTTGATAGEATVALSGGGAASVSLVTFARALPWVETRAGRRPAA